MNRIHKLPSCVFFDDVLCSFRKSEKSGIMNRCFDCRYYKKFVEEKEKEEEEFWREVDEMRRDEGFRCFCDGKLCDNEVVGRCFGISLDGKLFVCHRFDVNRFSDDSWMKKEFLRLKKELRGGGSVEC